MRKALALLLASLIMMLMMPLMFTSVASANVNEITDAAYITITVDEAKQMMDENQRIVILDVRTLAEYKSGHIDGSKLIPLLELEERINAIDGNSAVIVYCRSGVKSEKDSKILLDHGFDKVYNIRGGLNAWQDAGFPVVSNSATNHICPTNDSLSSKIDGTLSSSKSLFLFLYVDACRFCQQQIPIVDELEQEYAKNMTFLRVNCEEHPEVARIYGVQGYPAMFLIPGKGDNWRYNSQDFRGFTDRETLKKNIDYILKTERISGNFLVSILSYDECETNPSQCQCSFSTCLGGCLNIDPITIAGCAVSCGSCFASASIPGCIVCAACLGVGVTSLVNCIGKCQGDPCAYGYVCRPCNIKSPLNRRCYDSDTFEFEICKCDGQGWNNWKRSDCPSGKSCCDPGGFCVDLQTDPDNCGECGKACGANAYCSGGTCHCNEGYGNCDGDWSNGCEVNLNTDPNNCGGCGNACGEDYWDCYDDTTRAKYHCSCVGGSFYWEVVETDPCPEGEVCVDGVCEEEVPEFPAGVTAVFGATVFIFLMMRRKYVRK